MKLWKISKMNSTEFLVGSKQQVVEKSSKRTIKKKISSFRMRIIQERKTIKAKISKIRTKDKIMQESKTKIRTTRVRLTILVPSRSQKPLRKELAQNSNLQRTKKLQERHSFSKTT